MVSSSFISRSLAKMGFLERTQEQPQSHHFLIEVPAYSPMDETDFDLWKAHEVAGEEMGWILKEREESLLRRLCCLELEESGCETGRAWFVAGMVGK